MVNLKKLLPRMLKKITFSVESLDSSSTNIAAGSGMWINIPVTKSGKTQLAIAGYSLSGSYHTTCNVYAYYLNGNNATFALRNMGTSDATVTITARILYAGGVIPELIHRIRMACAIPREGVIAC